MTPPPAAVRGLVIRVRVTEPSLLAPEADGSSWQSLARVSAGRAVILDFARVSRIDARGLGIVAAFAEAVGARGGCLRSVRVRSRVQQTIDVAGLGDVVGLPRRDGLQDGKVPGQ